MARYWMKWSESAEAEGPFSATQLREMAAAGELSEEALISPDRRNWSPVRGVKNLLPLMSGRPSAAALSMPIGATHAHIPVAMPIGTATLPSQIPPPIPTAQPFRVGMPLGYAGPQPVIPMGCVGKTRNVRWVFICGFIMAALSVAATAPRLASAYNAPSRSAISRQYPVYRGYSGYGGNQYATRSLAGRSPWSALSGPELTLALANALVGFCGFVGLYIYFTVWVYQVHEEMRRFTGGQYPISSGMAAGFCWIPFFNCFWIVYVMWKLSQHINACLAPGAKRVSEGGVLTLQILCSIGLFCLSGIPAMMYGWSMYLVQSGLNRLWQQDLTELATPFTPGVGSF